MAKIRRGEIWRVRLSDPSTGRDARVTEMGGKLDRMTGGVLSERPCIVVSADDYNDDGDGVTVAPLTKYHPALEQRLFLWGPTIDYLDEVNIDPANSSYSPENERLWGAEYEARTGRTPRGILGDYFYQRGQVAAALEWYARGAIHSSGHRRSRVKAAALTGKSDDELTARDFSSVERYPSQIPRYRKPLRPLSERASALRTS